MRPTGCANFFLDSPFLVAVGRYWTRFEPAAPFPYFFMFFLLKIGFGAARSENNVSLKMAARKAGSAPGT